MVQRNRPRGSSSGATLATPATKTFTTGSWTAATDYYSITMIASEHGRGTAVCLYQIEELEDGDYCNITSGLRTSVDPDTGAITIKISRANGNDNRFAGRFLVW